MSAASDSDIRWLTPPPHLTAYFSRALSPGRVLRVSLMRALVPDTASTHFLVKGAMPDRWVIKFSAVRSAVRIARSGPSTVMRTAPASTITPSSMLLPADPSPAPTSWKAASATARPAMTPGARATTSAVPEIPGGIVAAVVTSGPSARSSARPAWMTRTTEAGSSPDDASREQSSADRSAIASLLRVAIGIGIGAGVSLRREADCEPVGVQVRMGSRPGRCVRHRPGRSVCPGLVRSRGFTGSSGVEGDYEVTEPGVGGVGVVLAPVAAAGLGAQGGGGDEGGGEQVEVGGFPGSQGWLAELPLAELAELVGGDSQARAGAQAAGAVGHEALDVIDGGWGHQATGAVVAGGSGAG